MGRKKRTQWDDSAYLNDRTYQDIYARIKGYAISVYEWLNLPDTVDERYMELALFERGTALWFQNDVTGDNNVLECTFGGELNIYRVPIWRTAYSVNGFQQQCTIEDSVMIFNNYLRSPTSIAVEMYARRLWEIQRTIDVNVKVQKTPILAQGTESQQLSLQNIWMNYDGNQPFMITDKSFDLDTFKVFQIGAPYVADKLYSLKQRLWNECLTVIGIENANTEKKERLVTDEVEDNNGQIAASRYFALNARKQACDQINKMFGLNIDVRFRKLTMGDDGQLDTDGGEDIGKIYDPS